jgi:hypothetical protein
LWGDVDQAVKAAAHCFFRTEAATLRNPFDAPFQPHAWAN